MIIKRIIKRKINDIYETNRGKSSSLSIYCYFDHNTVIKLVLMLKRDYIHESFSNCYALITT